MWRNVFLCTLRLQVNTDEQTTDDMTEQLQEKLNKWLGYVRCSNLPPTFESTHELVTICQLQGRIFSFFVFRSYPRKKWHVFRARRMCVLKTTLPLLEVQQWRLGSKDDWIELSYSFSWNQLGLLQMFDLSRKKKTNNKGQFHSYAHLCHSTYQSRTNSILWSRNPVHSSTIFLGPNEPGRMVLLCRIHDKREVRVLVDLH